MASKLRMGAVAYLNTRPLVYGIEQGLGSARIDLSYDVPAVLADRMRAEELDIALLPVIELARMPHLELVPGLGIVTRGDSRSVLLISHKPVGEIDSVALDAESRTSNALTRVLLAKLQKRPSRFEDGDRTLDEALAACDAAVRIGDKALFEPIPDGLHVLDLGGAWTDATGLPFVFAAWIARPGVIDRETYRILHESRRQGSRMTDAIADDYTWGGRHYSQIARDYLTRNISFRLGAPEIEAMRLFFALAASHGVIDRAPEIHLAFGQNTACHDSVARLGDDHGPTTEVPHA